MRMKEGKRPQYMMFTYGQLHSITTTKFSLPTGHITFKANRKRKSLIVVTLAADDLKIITHKYGVCNVNGSSKNGTLFTFLIF